VQTVTWKMKIGKEKLDLRSEILRRHHCIVFGGIICLLLSLPAIAQWEVFVPTNDVSFTISVEKSSYRTIETIHIGYRVKNISNHALYVPQEWEATCPAAPHLWVWVEDSAGKHFEGGYAGSCSSGPKTIAERMSKEAVLLKPGKFLDGSLRFDPTLFHLPPGAYRVEASLTGWTEERFSAADRAELQKMGHPFVRGAIPASTNVVLIP
jgi:hypothetical protein